MSPTLLLLILAMGLVSFFPKNGTGIGFWFAAGVVVYGGWWVMRTSALLGLTRRECLIVEQEIPQLNTLAQRINGLKENPFVLAPGTPLYPDEALNEVPAPLLKERLLSTLDGLRFGWESPQSDPFASSERRFATPERDLRSAMDVVLNVGIAGTFLSIFLSLIGDGKGLTSDAVLSHLGPGLISGMYAVATNVALRLSLTNLQEVQAKLETETDRCIHDQFLQKLLPERVNPTFALQRSLFTLGENISMALTKQTEQLNIGLADVFREPMQGVRDEIARMASASELLVVNSDAWSAVADRLYTAQENLLKREEELVIAHKTQIETVTDQLSKMLRNAVGEITTAQVLAFSGYETRLTDLQTVFREQFGIELEKERSLSADWLAKQREAADEWLEEAISRYGKKAEATLQETAAGLGSVIREVGIALPDAIHQTIEEGLTVAQQTGERLSEEMGKAAYQIEQVGQSVRDQVEAYRTLATRLQDAEVRLETLRAKHQTEFETTLAFWREGAQLGAEKIAVQLDEIARSQAAGWATLQTSQVALSKHSEELGVAFEKLTQTAKLLETPMEKLSTEVAGLQRWNETKARRIVSTSAVADERELLPVSVNP